VTPDRTDANPDENAEHGVLDESGNLDTASITILGGHIAQVSVDLPVAGDDDDLDDDVIEDEIPVADTDPPLLDGPREHRPDQDQNEIVHAPHVETLPTGDIILEPHDDPRDAASSLQGEQLHVHDAEVVVDDHVDEVGDEQDRVLAADDFRAPSATEAHGDEAFVPDAADAGPTAEEGASGLDGTDDERIADEVEPTAEWGESTPDPSDDVRADDLRDAGIVDDVELFEADAADPVDVDSDLNTSSPRAQTIDQGDAAVGEDVPDAEAALTRAPWVPAPAPTDVETATTPADSGQETATGALVTTESETETADVSAEEPVTAHGEDDVASAHEEHPREQEDVSDATAVAPAPTPAPATTTGSVPTGGPVSSTAPAPTPPAVPQASPAPPTGLVASTGSAPSTGPAPTAGAPGTGPVPATRAERAATGAIGTIPLTRRNAHQAEEAARAADEAARVDRAHAMERVRTPASEVALTSKRIGQIDDARESSDLLTADRLLDPRQIAKPEPEGLWQQLVYSVSGHRINLGDGRKARERKALDRRIGTPLSGGARFVPVLSRKGGVGKTTVTSLLGMALADARDDRIIAVDANPDRGTLADRVGNANGRTVRDLVRSHEEMVGFNDVSSVVARDVTRLDVLASDADPRVSEAFSDEDYRRVADVASHYYSIVLTDTGTGIVHSVMGATLELADTIVVVAGLSVDEARLASETLTWLETNGYAGRVRDAVVVLNNSRPGAPLVRESELEAHFRSRVRTVIRMPYDARIAAGSAIAFRDLEPATRQAARELAAAVVEGLRSPVAAA
jgi:MinD-like ATPase involved in chromosome partitioning or flagellar assembly